MFTLNRSTMPDLALAYTGEDGVSHKLYAKFVEPDAGPAADKADAKKANLQIGAVYPVADCKVGDWRTYIELVGCDGQQMDGVFNSCHFDFLNEDGDEVDVYHMPQFRADN